MYIGKDLHATFQRGILSAMGGIITNGCPGNSMVNMLERKHYINSSILKNILNFYTAVKSNLSLLFEFNNSRIFHKTPDYYCKFIIIDDSGNIRDMFELIEPYRIKKQFRCYGRHWHTYQRKHYRELNHMRKKRISSREANEIWNEYGVRIKKVKHRYRNWNWQTIDTFYSRCNKGKCWKEQSKRKRQWKWVEK